MPHKPAPTHDFALLKFSLFVCFIVLTVAFNLSPAQTTPILSVAGTGTNTYPGRETTYRLELLNHTDQIIYNGVLTATLPLGFSYVPGSTVALGEGWPMENREPIINGQTLMWGPYHLPAAGIQVHNPYGIHTLMDSCDGIPALHLEGAKTLVGNGGYITQLFYPIDTGTTGPSQCAINFINEAYARNLMPIIRLQGHRVNGIWQAPNPGPDGNYSEIAQAYANYVSGLPRRDTNPLYIAVWNEPDLWIEWSGRPNATQYARFFVAVSNAIRQLGDARIQIVNGALTPGNIAFLNRMLAVPGFRDAFDVWASHCYPYNHPAWYNNHSGTARYGTYSIDCYLEETARINAAGRNGIKVMLTETGYALGNNTYGFEGFSSINETNRANYIANAFKDYWQIWPEIVAVTPFELTDPSGHWHVFDWIYPYSPYPTHPQYDAVAALPKPAGELHPYGYQIIFKAKVGADVVTGTYTLNLQGNDREGHTTLATDAAQITVLDPDKLQFLYLPIILKSLDNTGLWYVTTAQTTPDDGTIMPTHLLTSTQPTLAKLAATGESVDLPLAGEPRALALDEIAGLGVIALSDGRVEIIDLVRRQSLGTVFVGDNPQLVITGTPGSGQAYLSLANGLAQIDMPSQRVVSKRLGLGRMRGLVWDSATQRLLAIDAEQDRLLVFNADLSQQTAMVPLEHQPDQLIFNSSTRQLYLSFPGASQVAAINVDTLTFTARASLAGGPILDMVFDTNLNRLYALSALTPNHQALIALDGLSLASIALVAGSADLTLQAASTLALTPGGDLLVSGANNLWQVSSTTFTINQTYPLKYPVPANGLRVSQPNGTIYMLEPSSSLLRIIK